MMFGSTPAQGRTPRVPSAVLSRAAVLCAQDDLDGQRLSGATLGLDAGLEELLLAMQKNVTNQARTHAKPP